MTLLVNVQGGTNAGKRRVVAVPTGPWPCNCVVQGDRAQLAAKTNPPWLSRCPRCRTVRPRA